MSNKQSCNHPPEHRWQGRDTWLCCKCYRCFWGSKCETPTVDVYGQSPPATPERPTR